MQDHLSEAIQKYNPAFTTDEIDLGMNHFEQIQIAARDHVLKAGEICKYLYFADKSIIRCYYYDQEGAEQTLWMKPEKTFVTEYKSFVSQEASRFSLQFYEDTTVWRIKRLDLLDLFARHNGWAQFGVFLTEALHVTLIDVFVNLLANDATQNYRYIEYMFPRFIQVAPLKDIASMLQITPVSLSRIRSGTQTKK